MTGVAGIKGAGVGNDSVGWFAEGLLVGPGSTGDCAAVQPGWSNKATVAMANWFEIDTTHLLVEGWRRFLRPYSRLPVEGRKKGAEPRAPSFLGRAWAEPGNAENSAHHVADAQDDQGGFVLSKAEQKCQFVAVAVQEKCFGLEHL